ncbi:uncharacterized protein LOC144066154 [Stigmatopora argus]
MSNRERLPQNTPLPNIKQKDPLKEETIILQWNANGVLCRMDELEQLLEKEKIDVCCIQESKLKTTDKLPRMRNYTAIFRDRMVQGLQRGGGVVTFIRTQIPYRLGDTALRDLNPGTDGLTVEIPAGKGPALKISNVYVPPVKSSAWPDEGNGCTDLKIELGGNEILLGDFNAHDMLWDTNARQDERGHNLTESLLDVGEVPINDGRHTRVDPGNGSKSAPDITIVPEARQQHFSWTALETLASDHLPIPLTVTHSVPARVREGRLVWNWKGANWIGFTDAIEEKLRNYLEHTSIKQDAQRLETAILEAAYANIGLKKAGQGGGPWMGAEVDGAIRRRDALKRDRHFHSDEYHLAENDVAVKICERKLGIWKRKVLEAKGTADMWSLLPKLEEGQGESKYKILMVDGQPRISALSKANAFKPAYQAASKLDIRKEDRWAKRATNIELRKPTAENVLSAALTMKELHTAIAMLNPSKSPGPDQMHPKFLHHLGPTASNILLQTFN